MSFDSYREQSRRAARDVQATLDAARAAGLTVVHDEIDMAMGRGTTEAVGSDQSWPNWYINRGRMSHNPTAKERRAVSWRRAL